jgi:hypothetical protein
LSALKPDKTSERSQPDETGLMVPVESCSQSVGVTDIIETGTTKQSKQVNDANDIAVFATFCPKRQPASNF